MQAGGATFTGYNPVNGCALEPSYLSASAEDVDHAVAATTSAFDSLANTSDGERAAFLRAIADGLDAAAPELIARQILRRRCQYLG